MKEFSELSDIQKNVLIGSIIGDGEITKIYTNSRRKNNSYREHFSLNQLGYRKWKKSFLPELLYLNSKSNMLLSRSLPLFTSIYSLFYQEGLGKVIPTELLPYCTLPHFLAIIYMDDGSFTISKRINHRKKLIYLTPLISLYLQNYRREDLEILKSHILKNFEINFSLNNRRDGCGSILRITSTEETFKFLKIIRPLSLSCPNMYYKMNWDWRFAEECKKYQEEFQDYKIVTSSSERFKNYSSIELNKIISLKNLKRTDMEIANELGRSYWSIVYKVKELRKDGLLE
jgi:hypothetical protein